MEEEPIGFEEEEPEEDPDEECESEEECEPEEDEDDNDEEGDVEDVEDVEEEDDVSEVRLFLFCNAILLHFMQLILFYCATLFRTMKVSTQLSINRILWFDWRHCWKPLQMIMCQYYAMQLSH